DDQHLVREPMGEHNGAATERVLPTVESPVVEATSGPSPAQLPLDVVGFTGRRRELALLYGAVVDATSNPQSVVVVALMGTAGVGKTALAVHWGRSVTDQFPDGQLFVDLHGFG